MDIVYRRAGNVQVVFCQDTQTERETPGKKSVQKKILHINAVHWALFKYTFLKSVMS